MANDGNWTVKISEGGVAAEVTRMGSQLAVRLMSGDDRVIDVMLRLSSARMLMDALATALASEDGGDP